MNNMTPMLESAVATPVLQLSGIRKSFNLGQANENEILHGIDLTLYPGEFCAVIGPSGSGKSTLLNTIGLLDRPTAGSLRIHGIETTSMNDAALTDLRGHHIGFVFQYHHLLSAFSALENVVMPLYADAGFLTPAMRERATVLLDTVGLTRWLHAPASHLSGGQQQRVAVARAVVNNPKLILADEPTGNLDSNNGNEVMQLLTELNEKGTTIVMVTHSEHDAKFSHRIIRMLDGQTVTENILV
jgi:lipoprotein-releasing system ATP-binding protein